MWGDDAATVGSETTYGLFAAQPRDPPFNELLVATIQRSGKHQSG